MARGLKFRIYVVHGSYYTYSENKGAVTVQLICVFVLQSVFSQQGSHENSIYQMGSISRHDMYLHTLPMTQTDVGLLFFDVLSFTDNASIENGKTSKKSMQKRSGGFTHTSYFIIGTLPVHSGSLKRIDYPKQICLAHSLSFECFHCS